MTPTLRLVIVEDMADDAELIVYRLRAEGFPCDWQRVEDEAGLLAALQPVPDLILADWTLPRFSGLQALELVRSSGLDIPFVIVSGSIGEQAAIAAMRLGAYDYVLKTDLTRLGQSVHHALEDKRLRDDRRRSHEMLVQLHRAMEQSPVSVIITDRQGAIEYVNPKFTEVTGYTLDEVKGRNPRLLQSGHTDPGDYRQLWETITSGRDWHGELQNRRKNGTIFWARTSISPIRDAGGDVTHFVACNEDITGQRQLERQLSQAQKMESVGLLAGGIAHDFNNLLTIINGYSELVLRNLAVDNPLRASLVEICDAGERAARLTRQLLAFSRKQVIEPRLLDMNALVANSAELIQRLIGEDIQLVLRLSPRSQYVLADAGQLDQVLLNLAANARDAMRDGGTLTIETAVAGHEPGDVAAEPGLLPGRYVVLTVRDTGVGMDAETQAHIFEPFFTTKEVGCGSGLGLASVYGVVHQVGGEIYVHSEPGAGTRFRIYLPEAEAGSVSGDLPLRKPSNLRGTETILLVEDEDAVRTLAFTLLEELGYRVLQAPDPAAALDLVQKLHEPIHLVLTDVVMPGLTGRELVERLRVPYPRIRVLYMSGYTQDIIARHGVLNSGVHFIAKPFSADGLALKLREVLDRALLSNPDSRPDAGPGSGDARLPGSHRHREPSTRAWGAASGTAR